jgi:hypothetical protein
MRELPISTLRQIIWGDDFELDKSTDLDEQADPMQSFILRNQVRAALGKSVNRTSVILNMSIPQGDVDGDEPLYKAPMVLRNTSSYQERSDERFQKVSAKIRAVFGPDHPEEIEEALAQVQKMRADARAEAIARA